jgi:hypothetical protein
VKNTQKGIQEKSEVISRLNRSQFSSVPRREREEPTKKKAATAKQLPFPAVICSKGPIKNAVPCTRYECWQIVVDTSTVL